MCTLIATVLTARLHALADVQNVPTIPEVTLPALLIVPVAVGVALLVLMQRSRSRARKRRPPS
jgi:hypothetical protein